MSFKHFILIGLLFVFGCAGEDQSFKRPAELKLSTASCFSELSHQISQYLKGKLSFEETKQIWSCVNTAIDKFVRITRSERDGVYSARSLRKFVEDFLLSGRKIPNPLFRELMKLKKLMVAGTTKSITDPEFSLLTKKFNFFGTLMLDLHPFMPILNAALNDQGGLNEKQLNAALSSLKKAGESLGREIGRSGQTYSFSNLEKLVVELLLVVQPTDVDAIVDLIKKFIPVIKEFKFLLISDDLELISAKDWSALLGTSATLFGTTLKLKTFVKGDSWQKGAGLNQLREMAIVTSDLFIDALKRRDKALYSYEELNGLIDAFENTGLIPLDLQAQTLKDLLVVLSEKVLRPDLYDFPKEFEEGLEISHFKAFQFEVNWWHKIQVELKRWPTTVQHPAVLEMIRVVDGPWPLTKDKYNRLIIDWIKPPKHNLSSRSELNWQRALVRLIIRGYSYDDDLRQRLVGLYDDEVEEFFEDFLPLAADLRLFDIDDTEAWKNIFLEASLFMPRSQGDEIFNFEEGIEYINYVFSGIAASKKLFQTMENICQIEEREGDKYLDAPCFRNRGFDHLSILYGHLPHLKSWLSNPLDPGKRRDRWMKYERNLEFTVVPVDTRPSDPLVNSDLTEMMVLSQYIETFFARFDQDMSHTVNYEEALVAFPVFAATLEKVSNFPSREDQLALFTYILKHGEVPSGNLAIIKFLHWKWHPELWVFEADRMRIVQILFELRKQL